MQFYTVTNRCAKTAYFPNMQFYFSSFFLYNSAYAELSVAKKVLTLHMQNYFCSKKLPFNSAYFKYAELNGFFLLQFNSAYAELTTF